MRLLLADLTARPSLPPRFPELAALGRTRAVELFLRTAGALAAGVLDWGAVPVVTEFLTGAVFTAVLDPMRFLLTAEFDCGRRGCGLGDIFLGALALGGTAFTVGSGGLLARRVRTTVDERNGALRTPRLMAEILISVGLTLREGKLLAWGGLVLLATDGTAFRLGLGGRTSPTGEAGRPELSTG